MTGINDRPIGVLDRPSVPRGWGSREERSIMRWGLAGFFLLAMYGVVFVLLGALVWS